MAWKVPTLARVANGWSMNTDTMGVYGNYYLKRAIVTQLGLGANLPEDAIYPLNLGDENGRPLDGASKYTIHFDKDGDAACRRFLVGHALRSGRLPGRQQSQPLCRQQLDAVQVQSGRFTRPLFPNDSPGADKEANWLPAPKGPFNLTMRLYAPKSEALTGKWNPPPVTRLQVPSLSVQ